MSVSLIKLSYYVAINSNVHEMQSKVLVNSFKLLKQSDLDFLTSVRKVCGFIVYNNV